MNAGAGLIRMPFLRYTVAMLIGCLAWAVIFATVGIAAVEASIALAARSPWLLDGVIVVGAVAVGILLTVRRRRSRGAAVVPVPDPGG